MPNEKQPVIYSKYFNKSLKAKEVLRLYKCGERNFQGVKLKGQSFKEQNLSGADFSNADLRSANFSNAILKNTIFQEARTGLTRGCGLVLCFNLGISLCILVAVLILVIALMIPVMLEIAVSERLITIGLIAGTILFAGSISGAIILEDAVSLIQTKKSEQVKLYFVLFILLIVFYVIVLFISAAQGIIAETQAITGVFLLSLILFLTYALWEILKQNGYLKSNWVRSLAIKLATMKDTSFRNADLTDADFSQAILEGADFREATLNNVCWHKALMTDRVRPEDTYLKNDRIRQLVISKQGQNEIFNGEDLRNLNLQNAILTNASFFRAKLNEANLQDAELSNTNFLEADLCGATLTGVSIQDWNVNNQTNLEDIACNYVFLKEGQKERLPHNPDRNFEPKEFAKYVEKAINTVELIFNDGIDWNAFLTSFQDLQDEYGVDKLGVRAIERKSDDAFVIRLEVPLDIIEAKAQDIIDAIKDEFETFFWQNYNASLENKDREIKRLSQQTELYYQEIESKRKDIEFIRKDNTRLIGIIETMEKKEISKVNMIFEAPVYGVAGNIEGNQIIYTSQSLAEVSTKIQNLLTELKNKGLTQEQAEGKVASDLATQAQNDPTALGNLVNWGKYLGNKAAETSISEVVRRVIKLGLNLAGVPIP